MIQERAVLLGTTHSTSQQLWHDRNGWKLNYILSDRSLSVHPRWIRVQCHHELPMRCAAGKCARTPVLCRLYFSRRLSRKQIWCVSQSVRTTQMTCSCTLSYRKRPSMMQSPTYKTVCSTFTSGSVKLDSLSTRTNLKRCSCQLYSMLEQRLRC